MKHIFGNFTQHQIIEQKKILHSMIFWLLLYKDPKTSYKFKYVDFDKYFNSLMSRISGFGELIFNPPEIVSLLSILEGAYLETQKDFFDFLIYRKLILDAHSLVDKIKEVDSND